MKHKKQRKLNIWLIVILILVFFITKIQQNDLNYKKTKTSDINITLKDIPPYQGQSYVILKNNQPNMDDWELSGKSFERYSPLDIYGRCGVAVANLGLETMPKKKRESISHVKPSGWQISKYNNIDGKYLYNRCHLIGYQLSAENDNERNLITGTRYFNVDGMLPFENQVADYIKRTGNHVLYRVTPLYEGNDLVAKGVIMEAKSYEDKGKGVQFCVFVYNIQPGIDINYKNGHNRKAQNNNYSELFNYLLCRPFSF